MKLEEHREISRQQQVSSDSEVSPQLIMVKEITMVFHDFIRLSTP
jgi:hypothetical protein